MIRHTLTNNNYDINDEPITLNIHETLIQILETILTQIHRKNKFSMMFMVI